MDNDLKSGLLIIFVGIVLLLAAPWVAIWLGQYFHWVWS